MFTKKHMGKEDTGNRFIGYYYMKRLHKRASYYFIICLFCGKETKGKYDDKIGAARIGPVYCLLSYADAHGCRSKWHAEWSKICHNSKYFGVRQFKH